jgi:hypothetical protein
VVVMVMIVVVVVEATAVVVPHLWKLMYKNMSTKLFCKNY